MAKLKIPVVVDISEIESLIDEIKHLQTYKLSSEDEQILIDRDDVVRIFRDHVRANIKPSAEPNSDRYEQGIIEGRVQMRTELLTKLKGMVGEEIWTNI